MEVRYCKQHQPNIGHPIFGVCLQESCQNHPLVCKTCILQNHQGHLILSLDYLRSTCKNADIPQKLSTIISHYDEMGEQLQYQCQNITNRIGSAFFELKQKIINDFPIGFSLSQPFKKIHIPAFINYISTSKEFSLETMKSLLPLIRDYYFLGGYNICSLKMEKDYKYEKTLNLFLKAEAQTMTILNNLNTHLKEIFPSKTDKTQMIIKQEDVFDPRLVYHQQKYVKEEIEEESEKTEQQLQKQKLQKFNLLRHLKDNEAKVVLRQTKDSHINSLIEYIDTSKIKELTLCNNAHPCAIDSKAIDHISRMQNLEVLRLFWAQSLRSNEVLKMTRNMTQLKELILCQFEDCCDTFVNVIKINNPQLRKVCFSMDILHFVRFNQQHIEFMPDTAYQFQNEKTWISLSRSLPSLTNLELHNPENKAYWIKYLTDNSKLIREFTLSNIDQSKNGQRYKQYNYSPLLKSLEQCRGLRCLRLQEVHFMDKHLMKVIENNPRLITFMASQCSCISLRTYQLIGKICTNLQQFSVQMDDKFKIQTIESLVSLKTLVLRGCWGIKDDRFVDVISKMASLKSLSIQYNSQWVTSKVLIAICKIPHLKVLNISGNNLTSGQIKYLSDLPYLNTLICHMRFVHLL